MSVLPDPAPAKTLPVVFGTAKDAAGRTVVTLTVKMYENLSKNWAEATRWAGEARYRLDYYRRELTLGPLDNPK